MKYEITLKRNRVIAEALQEVREGSTAERIGDVPFYEWFVGFLRLKSKYYNLGLHAAVEDTSVSSDKKYLELARFVRFSRLVA